MRQSVSTDNTIEDLDDNIAFTKDLLKDPSLPDPKRVQLENTLQVLLKRREALEKAQIAGTATKYLPQTLAAGAVAAYWFRSEKYRQSLFVPFLASAGAFYLTGYAKEAIYRIMKD